jgi:hypothetical protein
MNEAGDNLVPWNGQQDNMIDRSVLLELLAHAAGMAQHCSASLVLIKGFHVCINLQLGVHYSSQLAG